MHKLDTRDCLHVLAAFRDLDRGFDVVDEAWQWRSKAEDESDHSSPVGTISGRVTVHAVEIVHVGNGYATASNNVITADWC